MSYTTKITIKCSSKDQIFAIENCTIKLSKTEKINFADWMQVNDLTISFVDCFLWNHILDGLPIMLCRHLAQSCPSLSFSLKGYYQSRNDDAQINLQINFDGKEMTVNTKTGYFSCPDVDLESDCAYLGKQQFISNGIIPDFHSLGEEAEYVRYVICNDKTLFPNEMKICKKNHIKVLGEREFIKKHLPYEPFREMFDFNGDCTEIEFASDYLSMDIKDELYKMENGKLKQVVQQSTTQTTKKRKRKDWILPCNLKYYDISNALADLKTIDWKQLNKSIAVNDIIYIYVGEPIYAIKYKCKVTKTNLSFCEIDIGKYVKNKEVFEKYGNYIELEYLQEYSDNFLTNKKMNSLGMNSNIKSIKRLPDCLSEFL